MKTKNIFSFVTAVFLMLQSSHLMSQDAVTKSFAVYPSLGLGIGFFYPADVNDYISEEIVPEYGTGVNTELYMYLEVKGGVTFRMKTVDFSVMAEYDIAPKFVIVSGGDNMTYGFSRFAPEISANYYIPGKSGKNAFFVGGGFNYSFMKFEEFRASCPGFKIQLGYSLQFGNFNLQPYGAFRYVSGSDDEAFWGSMQQTSGFDLNYTGGQIGVILSFHPRILYR